MDDAKFLVARIDAKTAAEGPLDWVTEERRPYRSTDPLDLDDRTLNSAFDMYSRVYGKIDNKLNIPVPDGLFEYNRWILIQGPKGKLRGFVLL